MTIHSYKELIVWQKAMELVEVVYRITANFPKEEIYGLTSQMRRSVISIPSNIAEGRFRRSRKEFRNFLFIAYGSGAELETQLDLSLRLSYLNQQRYNEVSDKLQEVMKMLNAMKKKLKANQANT